MKQANCLRRRKLPRRIHCNLRWDLSPCLVWAHALKLTTSQLWDSQSLGRHPFESLPWRGWCAAGGRYVLRLTAIRMIAEEIALDRIPRTGKRDFPAGIARRILMQTKVMRGGLLNIDQVGKLCLVLTCCLGHQAERSWLQATFTPEKKNVIWKHFMQNYDELKRPAGSILKTNEGHLSE